MGFCLFVCLLVVVVGGGGVGLVWGFGGLACLGLF